MKKIRVYTIILLILFLMISIRLSYAFYVPNITGIPTENTINISNKGVEVNYLNGSDIVINNTKTTVTKNITIKNTSRYTFRYRYAEIPSYLLKSQNEKSPKNKGF